MRSTHEAEARFYRDSDYTNLIRWYKTPADAPIHPHPGAFVSSNWENLPGHNDLGEQWSAPRKWSNGKAPYATSNSPCGPADWWYNGVPSISLIGSPVGPDGRSICCSGAVPAHEGTAPSGASFSSLLTRDTLLAVTVRSGSAIDTALSITSGAFRGQLLSGSSLISAAPGIAAGAGIEYAHGFDFKGEVNSGSLLKGCHWATLDFLPDHWWPPGSLAGFATGSPLDVWPDVRNAGYNLGATGQVRPVVIRDYRGCLPFVRFDGIDDSMKTVGGLIRNHPATVFMVIRPRPSTVERGLFGNNNAQANTWEIRRTETNQQRMISGTSSLYGYLLPPEVWSVCICVFNTTTSRIQVNDRPSVTAALPQTTNNPVYQLGRSANAPLYPFAGDVGEVLVYNSALSEGAVGLIYKYLKQKWDL